MSIQVIPVQTPREKRDFLKLPWKIYKSNEYWIPPLKKNQKELVGFADHPFYENAEAQAFLATQDGKPVGRLHAIVDHGHNTYYKEKRGFFGFFESIDNSEVARKLFDAGKQWHAERDIFQIRGPSNPSMNYECGLLVDSFDIAPTFMMTYNNPYYERLILENGFLKSQDLYSFYCHVSMLAKLDKKLAFIGEETISRFNVKMRPIDKKNFERDLGIFMDIYNRSLPGQWGFVPMSQAEVNHTAQSLKFLLATELTSIAEVDGKAIGVQFALLDYNPRIKKINGSLFPFGFLKLLFNKRQIKKIRMISTNVVPEYQKWGIGLALLYQLVPDILEWGIQEAELSWVLESNKLSRGTIERSGADREKTHRMYDYDGSSS